MEISRLVETFFNESRRAAAFSADLINVEAIPCLIEQVASHLGRLDILINSAANFLQPKFGETTQESWDASLDTNLRARRSSAPKLRNLTSLNQGKILHKLRRHRRSARLARILAAMYFTEGMSQSQ